MLQGAASVGVRCGLHCHFICWLELPVREMCLSRLLGFWKQQTESLRPVASIAHVRQVWLQHVSGWCACFQGSHVCGCSCVTHCTSAVIACACCCSPIRILAVPRALRRCWICSKTPVKGCWSLSEKGLPRSRLVPTPHVSLGGCRNRCRSHNHNSQMPCYLLL